MRGILAGPCPCALVMRPSYSKSRRSARAWPAPATPRASVALALGGALLGDEFDLDEHLGIQERQHVNEGERGADVAEDLAVGPAGLFPLADVRQVQLGLHHVLEAEAGLGQHGAELLQDVAGLGIEVLAHDSVLTAGGGRGDVEGVVHLDSPGIAEGLFPGGAGTEGLAHGGPFTVAAGIGTTVGRRTAGPPNR